MKVPFVNFGQQYLDHKGEYDEAIQSLLTKGQLILQEEGEKFEENLAKYLGMRYAVAVGSGTDALTIALKIKNGAEPKAYKVTDYTFKATHEAIHHSGNVVDRVDIDKYTRLPSTEVDVPVHIEGMVSYSPNAVIEDACQAFGAKNVGYSGTACYSFYPAKIFGGPGDGGAIVTNDRDMYDLAKLYRHHYQTGVDEQYAYCSRLDNIKAGYLNVKLRYMDGILARREEIAMRYLKELQGYVGLPVMQEGRVWQDFVVTHKDREGMVAYLRKNDIGILGDNMTTNADAMNWKGVLPNVKELYKTMFRLPCNETLTDEQVEYVIEKVKEYVPTV